MTTYTDVFGGSPVATNPDAYRAFSFSVDTTLSWALYNEDVGNIATDRMDITASTASLSLLLPPSNQVSVGYSLLIRNTGANTFTVKTNIGGTIQAIAAGQIFYVYVTDNSTVAGTWSSFQFGTGTSTADANFLAGQGLVAISQTLNVAFPSTDFNAGFQLTTGYRGTIANWTGGSGTFTFAAAATLGNNWFVLIKNSGSGVLTLDPSETIDGVSSINLNPLDSAIVACNGSLFLTIGRSASGSSAVIFTRLVKSVAGAVDVTLTSAEAAFDIQEYTGAITANINVIVPTAVGRWWFYNNTTGAFTVTIKTSAGTGIALAQGTRSIYHCDGTNVVRSVDTGSGTVTSIATGTGLSGGPITTSGTINLANTAVAAGTYGGSIGVFSETIDAQGRATAASFTARSVTAGTGIAVTNGDGVAGAPTVALAVAAANTFKANNTGGSAVPTDITVTAATAALNVMVGDSGAGGTKGLAPAPAAGDTAAGKFLKASGAYAQVTDANLSVSNITTNNVTTSAHGFAPILPNDSTKFLNGVGAYAVPPSGGLPTAVTGTLSGASQVYVVDFTTYAAYDLYIGQYSTSLTAGIIIEMSSDGGGSYYTQTIARKDFSASSFTTVSSADIPSASSNSFTTTLKVLQPTATAGTYTTGITGSPINGVATSMTFTYNATTAAVNRLRISSVGGTLSAGSVRLQPISAR